MPNYNKGQLYEMKIREILRQHNLLPENLHGNDAGFFHKGFEYFLEIKNKQAPDYGQKRLIWSREKSWEWSIQDVITVMYDDFGVKELIDKDFIPRRYSVPEDILTEEDREFDQKKFEKSGIRLSEINCLHEYYARKECYYIHIEGKGFYYLLEDVANLGVPQFAPTISLRLRAKVHHSFPIYKYSFFAVMNIKRKDIRESIFDIEEIMGRFPHSNHEKSDNSKTITTLWGLKN